MNATNTGLLIAQARKEKELTQKDLAQALHVSIQAVSKWERGLNFPDIALLEPLSELLGLTVSELLSGERGTVPREEQVRESLRVSLSQLGGKIKKWRGLFWLAFALLLALTIRLGYVYVRDNTELLPQAETVIVPRENTESENMAAKLGQMTLNFFELTVADGVMEYSLDLELWTHEGLARTWPIAFASMGDDPRRQPVALAYKEEEETSKLSTVRYAVHLAGVTFSTPCEEVPGLQNGYTTSFLAEPTVVSPDYGVVLSCTSLDLEDRMEWRVPGWVGAIEDPVQDLEEGEGMLLVRLRCE